MTEEESAALKRELDQIDKEVGRRLRERRCERGLSQNDLGSLMGISFQQIQKYERGQNRISASSLFLAGKILETPVFRFFEEKARGKQDDVLLESERQGLIRTYFALDRKLRAVCLRLMRAMKDYERR